ncbi:uncharacterized protein LOC141804834 [Halichoeres trimaculatus]|uniref:uncharacterized protein LOC141804834 n=1 Tax=Halichoeres trimaculatus TaxID=147232 RepID=UPI003D9F6399
MDWFHCNQCFTSKGTRFSVSSCGHIFCEGCIKSKQCSVCGASCSYLPITDEMKPQQKVFFMDPMKLMQSRLEHISQVAIFQRTQIEIFYKHKYTEIERRLKEVTEQSYRQLLELKRENTEQKKLLSELKRENTEQKKLLLEMKREDTELKKQLLELQRENAELKKPLSQRRVSPGLCHTKGSQRISLPVAVTSPVTPYSRPTSHRGSAELQGWARDRGPSQSSLTTPGSTTTISSHSSLHEHVHRTPTSYSNSNRVQRQTPDVFQLQFMRGLSIQSPRH